MSDVEMKENPIAQDTEEKKGKYNLDLSKKASEIILSSLKSRGKGIGIRLGVRTSGCNGYSYVMEFVDKTAPEDIVFKFGDVTIVSDDKSMGLLNGLLVDYVKEGLEDGFKFINPNASGECGCGESFNI